jgi:hypothetical protein
MSNPLNEISSNGPRNISHLNIKEVDSPISCMQKSMFRHNNYFSAKDRKPVGRLNEPIECKVKLDDLRVLNMDKINQKIKSILNTIEGN